MLLGHRMGCHQRPDRSFFFRGRQFPLCARCTGVLLGYFLAIPLYVLVPAGMDFCLKTAAIMLIDWLLQYIGFLESTNFRRLVTGICGGYGVATAHFLVIAHMIEMLF